MACTIFDSPLPLRNFSSQHIYEYMLKINELNDDNVACSAIKSHIAGIKMFQSNFIGAVTFTQSFPDGTLEVFGSVRAECKTIVYNVGISIDTSNDEILKAECRCPGGTAPSSCKHVFAVLAFLQEYCSKELYNAPTEVLQQWHKPSKKSNPMEITDIVKSSCSKPWHKPSKKKKSPPMEITDIVKSSCSKPRHKPSKKKSPPMEITDIVKSSCSKPSNMNTKLNFDALFLLERTAPIFSVLNDDRFTAAVQRRREANQNSKLR